MNFLNLRMCGTCLELVPDEHTEQECALVRSVKSKVNETLVAIQQSFQKDISRLVERIRLLEVEVYEPVEEKEHGSGNCES